MEEDPEALLERAKTFTYMSLVAFLAIVIGLIFLRLGIFFLLLTKIFLLGGPILVVCGLISLINFIKYSRTSGTKPGWWRRRYAMYAMIFGMMLLGLFCAMMAYGMMVIGGAL